MFYCRKKSHPKITPEIRRELQAAQCRDVEVGQSLALEGEVEFEEDNDYTPMEDDEMGHGSQRGSKSSSGQQPDENMDSDEDDEDDDDDDDDDEEEL